MSTKAENLIGIRQYLNSTNSFQDLHQLITLWHQQSPAIKHDFNLAVALCGKDPRPFLKEQGLLSQTRVYDYSNDRLSPNQLIKRLIFEYQADDRVQIIYYSPYPEGLTYPVDLFTQMGVFLSYKNLAVSDSDFQIPFEELIRSFYYHIQKNDIAAPLITFPKRRRRSLDAQDYPINRWAMEDIENLYVYFLSNIRFLDLKLDIQSGLFFTNHIANMHLDFDRVGKWVGTLHLAISLLRHPHIQVEQIEVNTNTQDDSTISFEVQCNKINELYDYYLIPMENIIRIALDNPRKYLMDDWTRDLTVEEIRTTLENIFQAYLQFKNKVAV